MNERTHDIQQVAMDIDQSRELIRRREVLRRLEQNEDFKELIHEGYFKDEATRVVALKSDPNFLAGGEKGMLILDNIISGIGALRQYFITIHQMAQTAEMNLAADEETQENLLAEDLDEGVH